ncbi:hypothetical protein PGIGA_G00239740 [Pangasianodon gigas]|uniref:Uncharacterized protein n=1 Tax=Pangasianodon gigas TaxID=30993 RepID=A0ACC5WNF3_PANGG|nr:hypothetical protein [Pangasianodon gigas]
MTESASRPDQEQPNSTLNNLSDQPDWREAQRYAVGPRTVIMLHANLLSRRKQEYKGHEHRADCCVPRDGSGACIHHRFTSAPQSGEEHLHREQTEEIAEGVSHSSEKQMTNTEVQSFSPGWSYSESRDDDRPRAHLLLFSITILILLLLTLLVLIPYMKCAPRSWCF